MTRHTIGTSESGEFDGAVCCLLGMERYAIRGRDVRIVARAEEMRREEAADGRIGVLVQGGQVLPVYGLADLLGRQSESFGEDHHVVVTQGEGEPFGLLVDRLLRVPVAGGVDVLPLSPVVGQASAAWFEGLLARGDESCLVLSPTGVDPQARRGPRARAATAVGPSRAVRRAGRCDLVAVFTSPALPAGEFDRYGIAVPRIDAVVRELPHVPVPGSPPWIRALGWWKDATLPILDFRGNAGAGIDGEFARYLVARHGPTRENAFVAIPVDDDITLYRATDRDRRLTGRTEATVFVRGTFRTGNERLGLLDLDALITSGARVLSSEGGNGQGAWRG